MSDSAVQTRCCRHTSRWLCTTAPDACAQGYGSHALPDHDHYEATCECGTVTLTSEVWKSCSGRRHVYVNGATTCSCRQKHGHGDG